MMNTLEAVRKPVHNACFGIEIEGYLPNHIQTDVVYKYHRFFYAGVDSSLYTGRYDGTRGIEFVSQPLPFDWLTKEIKKLGTKHPWTWNDTCGIHVHVSRNSVSLKRIQNLLRAFRLFTKEQQKELFGRTFNTYCDPFDHDRYCTINTTNKNTVEFRMFSSGDYKWAQECLRRTKLMYKFKGKPTYENLLDLFTSPEK